MFRLRQRQPIRIQPDPEHYTVTIPAEISVAWNDTAAQNASYTVDSQLNLGAKLKVSVQLTMTAK